MATHSTLATAHRNQRTEITRAFWQILSSTRLLGIVGATVFILFLCAVLIRQMPGQIASDPAAATRWLLTVTEEYGALGHVLRTLGLFDVLHHPLLQLLLAVVALVLLVHLGNLVAALWRFRQVAHWLTAPVVTAGDAIALPQTQPLYRLRQPAVLPPAQLVAQLADGLRLHFDEVLTATVNTRPHRTKTTVHTLETVSTTVDAIPAEEQEAIIEFRLLARRHQNLGNWLRPFFSVGLLLALSAVWLILLAGWEVTPPPLAPGDEYRATTQRVVFVYTLPTEDNGTAALAAEIDGNAYQLPLGESQQLRLGEITIEANPGPPALLIRSADDATTLSRAGQTQHIADLGLIFPSLGSEDSVVIGSSVGLRIVRVAVSSPDAANSPLHLPESRREQFLVEVYQSDKAKPVQTLYLQEETPVTIEASGETHQLTFIPLPSLLPAVRYQPGVWLLWLALLLVMGGMVGALQQPAFLLIQIAPWSSTHTVLIAQSDLASEIDRIRRYLQ